MDEGGAGAQGKETGSSTGPMREGGGGAGGVSDRVALSAPR